LGVSPACADATQNTPMPYLTVSAAIASGLAADTEYHYRISATNSSGTSKGVDVTFKTS